jgi:hypothetical protein
MATVGDSLGSVTDLLKSMEGRRGVVMVWRGDADLGTDLAVASRDGTGKDSEREETGANDRSSVFDFSTRAQPLNLGFLSAFFAGGAGFVHAEEP